MCRKLTMPAAAGASRVAWCLLLLSWLAISSNLPICYAKMPVCQPVFQGDRYNISHDCSWPQQRNLPSKRIIVAAGKSAAMLPALNLDADAEPGPPADYSLIVKRVVLRGMTLAPLSKEGGLPRLLPMGMFAAVPRNLYLYDVRAVVTPEVFADYLKFFRQQLRTARDTSAGPSLHTDNSTVLNIPYWSDNTTEVFSFTVVSGACKLPGAEKSPWADSVKAFPTTPGCSIRIVDNRSLVPTLIRDAGISTSDMLLIRLTDNVTLGPGITHSIPIRRPILLLGMVSAPTSVDMGMVVNQLNVTPPYGQITWQGLVLENLAPGDAVSSLVAPPFSTTVSSNVWAMYCNRSASSCLNLNNVTLVVPSQEELNYQVFMYTMFNSPAPALRELTSFYRSDLNASVIQFVPGPGNDTLTIIRLVNTGWNFWYVICTLKPFFAPKRPMPRQALVMQRYRAGALVYALQDCGGFVSALLSRSTSTRTRVWTLINNVSIADNGNMQCSWPDGNVTYPTQLLGPVVHTHGPSARVHDKGTVASPLSPEAIVLGHADAALSNRNGNGNGNGLNVTPADPYQYQSYDIGDMGAIEGGSKPPYDQQFALSFGYLPRVFQLPADAQDKFLQIQNVTLMQLPQMGPAMGQTGSLRGLRRLLNMGNASPPVGIWTVLLWPVRRTMWGSPVTISDSQLVIPQPEWAALAAEARQAASFAVQLQGQAGGLTFTGVSLLDNNTMRVGAFQGPGISGTNLWLLQDSEAAKRPDYHWPYELFVDDNANSGGGGDSGTSVALRAGVGASVAVMGLLALALVGYVIHSRRRRTHSSLLSEGYSTDSKQNGTAMCDAWDPTGPKFPPGKGLGGAPGVGGHAAGSVADVALPPDAMKAVVTAAGGAAAAAGAAAVLASAEKPAADAHSDGSSIGGSLVGVGLGQEEGRGSSKADAGVGAGEVAGGSPQVPNRSPSLMEQTIASGLERWNAALSQTTLQIMQRRLQSNNALYSQGGSTAGSSLGGGAGGGCSSQQQQRLRTPAAASIRSVSESTLEAALAASAAAAAAETRAGSDGEQGLQLHSVIGTGSFGSVYIGSWRGKRVAIKVMHLQSNALMDADHAVLGSKDLTPEQQERLQQQRKQNSPPHMAIMEAVVSSTMSHPNVVQVYTYMLSPLMVQPGVEAGHAPVARQQQREQQEPGHASGAEGQDGGVFGWQLRLVMEYCDQGTLRDALDKRRLPRLCGTPYPHPSVVFSLCHDITAALLHLHTEGIVHGDLKAGNVLLTANPTPGSSNSSSERFTKSTEVWREAGSPPLSAKVADFGMSLPLGPKDTHATMLARGTPTHMSPELFMEGHVSKASDVYAYGILLYEIITGRRAYAGVPIPLLPHEVAMQGLRPEWPSNLPEDSLQLRDLAELCWKHHPQDRPGFHQIMDMLEGAGLPQQQQQQQGASCSPQQPLSASGSAAGSGAACRPMQLTRKGSRDMDWSEISYGGSRHDGGWS